MNGNGNNGQRDRMFVTVLIILGVLMVIFGAVAIALVAAGTPSENVVLRLINAFGAMFTGLLGLTVGYLTGRR